MCRLGAFTAVLLAACRFGAPGATGDEPVDAAVGQTDARPTADATPTDAAPQPGLGRKKRITITTFMIATDAYLVEFVDKLTKINRGRAYYASPYNLAEFLFTDYIRNRKKFLH